MAANRSRRNQDNYSGKPVNPILLPIYASIAPSAEIRMTFNVPPGASVSNHSNIKIQQIKIESTELDFIWLPNLINETKV